MPNYHDPVTKKWSFENGNAGWSWPWIFFMTIFGIAGSVIGLLALLVF